MLWRHSEIRRLVETAWATMLGLEVRPAAEVPAGDWPGGVLTGAVTVSGPWSGVVTLDCPADLSRRFAAAAFAVPPERVTEDQCRDVLGELTNILGGGLKSLLPETCSLGLPVVAAGACPAAGHPLCRAAFCCLGQPLLLTVHEVSRETGPGR